MIEDFGEIKGLKYNLYTIENNFMKISVSDYGACLVNFIDKRNDINIIKGFDDVSDYYKNDSYMGMSVGRVCNRIGEGKFTLQDKEYKLYINNGPNSLHGGENGLSFRRWDMIIQDNMIICNIFSKDGDEGYPGNVDIEVKYILEGNSLTYQYTGKSDKDTLLSITNHSYFNLNGRNSKTIENHNLKINSKEVALIDENGLAQSESFDVTGTPFDYREFRLIGDGLKSDHQQIIRGGGYDHHFIIEDENQPAIDCYGDACELKIYTNLPGVQMYTANFLPEPRSAVCFESQFYPNAINYNNRIKPILKKNEVMRYKTKYIVSEVK